MTWKRISPTQATCDAIEATGRHSPAPSNKTRAINLSFRTTPDEEGFRLGSARAMPSIRASAEATLARPTPVALAWLEATRPVLKPAKPRYEGKKRKLQIIYRYAMRSFYG